MLLWLIETDSAALFAENEDILCFYEVFEQCNLCMHAGSVLEI